MGEIKMNDTVIMKNVTKKDWEDFVDSVFEAMEEVFPEFMWDGKLVKSTKYKGEQEEEL